MHQTLPRTKNDQRRSTLDLPPIIHILSPTLLYQPKLHLLLVQASRELASLHLPPPLQSEQ